MAGQKKSKKRQPQTKSKLTSATKQKAPSATTDLPPSLSRKKTAWESIPSSVPGYGSNVTSRYAREKARFKISKAALEDESINEQSISRIIATGLHRNSSSQETWGVSIDQPIEAPRKKKTGATLKRFTQKSLAVPVQPSAEILKDARPCQSARTPIQRALTPTSRPFQQARTAGTPGTSHLLKLPLELREMIYGYLIQYDEPLKVKPDWRTVEISPHFRHSIFSTCKQMNQEATAYLLRSNSIHVFFWSWKLTNFRHLYGNPLRIDHRSISSYRSVIMEFQEDCEDSYWLEKATQSIKTLVKAKPTIACLTLVVVPRRRKPVLISALGMEFSPVTFADFLSHSGSFMILLRQLAPSRFDIVANRGDMTQLFASLDLRYLQADKQQAVLRGPEISETLSAKGVEIDAELKNLKAKFEQMFSAGD